MKEPGLKRNLTYAIGAEGLQLLQSVLMSLIIPKILGVEQYGFWQLFIFYTSYGGFFHMGLLDGIYLKIGGKKKEDIDFHLIGSQLNILIVWLCIALSPLVVWGCFGNDLNRTIVVAASCIYIVLFNIYSFHSYLLQCINNIKAYSIGRFIDMSCFICGLLILLLGKVDFFLPYIIAFIIAKIVSLLYYAFLLKKLWGTFARTLSKNVFFEIKDNIKIGINLMASNIASMLVLGIGRWLVDKEWGIESFSKVSFSLIVVNFFMMFIQQASRVLFPDLRRRNADEVESIYDRMSNAMHCVIPIALVSYLPFALLIQYWLPVYMDSIIYLIYLLPLCCFDAKMQLIYSTMFKVKRLERKLLICNVLSLTVSTFFVLVAIYIFKSLTSVVIAMLFAIFFRSFVAECMIECAIKGHIHMMYKSLFPELVMIAIFIAIFNLFNLWLGTIIYILSVCIYITLNHEIYRKLSVFAKRL